MYLDYVAVYCKILTVTFSDPICGVWNGRGDQLSGGGAPYCRVFQNRNLNLSLAVWRCLAGALSGIVYGTFSFSVIRSAVNKTFMESAIFLAISR